MKATKTYPRIGNKSDEDLPGYPEYSNDEDIYANAEHEDELDPETVYNRKKPVASFRKHREDDDDLDIPGTEYDDEQEDVGSEDEENNYYSLSDNDDLEDLI